MAEKKLKKTYDKFLKFHKKAFIENAKFWLGVEELKLKNSVLERIYENYEKNSFLAFLKRLKDIIYSENVFDYVLIHSTEQWPLYNYLYFFKKEGWITIKRNGKVLLLEKKLLDIIPPPVSKEEAQKKIEKKIRRKLDLIQPTTNLFKTRIVPQYDQMPISISSALFLVEKISEYLPLNKKFLFVGDDDLVSVFLGLSNPQIESVVVDIDEELLKNIEEIAKKFQLKIKTKKVDIQKQKSLGEKYIGFLANPAYNFEGVKQFTSFGTSLLGREGGYVFLEIGDESIGNRFLFLEDFFTKKKLITKEVLKKKIFYPWISLHKEDEVILERMQSFFDKKVIERNPKLGASLYVFEYLPFQVKKVKIKESMYSYI